MSSSPVIYYHERLGICSKDTPGANQYVRADIMFWHDVDDVLPRVDGLSSGWVEVFGDFMKYPGIACITSDGEWLGLDKTPLRFVPRYWRPIVYPNGYVSSLSRSKDFTRY